MSAPIAEPHFRRRIDLPPLPRARPPRWMHRSVVWSVVTLAVLAVILFLLPFDERVVTVGTLYHGGAVSIYAPQEAIVVGVAPRVGDPVEAGKPLLKLANPNLAERHAALAVEAENAKAALAAEEARFKKVSAAPLPAEFLFSTFDIDRHSEVKSLQEAFLKKLEAIEKAGAASQAEVLNLRLQLITNETLLRRSLLARDLLEGPYGGATREEARLRVEEAKTRLRGIEARLTLLSEQMEALVLRAPISGVIVASTRRDPGEKVMGGEELIEIAPGGVDRLRLRAPADRLHRIRPGLAVRFRAASEPDPLLPPGKAVVLSVDRSPVSTGLAAPDSSLERRFEEMSDSTVIRAEVLSSPSPLMPDVPVRAEIVLGARPLWRLVLGDGILQGQR